LLWVDIDERDDQHTLDGVADHLGLGEADVDRLAREVGRAHLTRTQDWLHLTLEALEPDDQTPPRLIRRELDLVATRNVVLTVHTGPMKALNAFVGSLEGETRLGALDAADLLSSLVDEVIVGYFQLAEMIEQDIDDLDQLELRGRREDDILGAIVELRRRVGYIRRTLAPHRDALATLRRPEMRVEETIGQPWPGLIEHLEGALSATEGLRDGLLGTYDIHMGRVSQHANDVMKVLTLLSAVLLPGVVIAGVMGMNFAMPFFEDTRNFWVVLVAMAGLGVIILAVARRRGWL
jgi:magnesium/cobalt transport protein CorA